MESPVQGVTRSRSHPYSTVRGVRGVSATNVTFRYIEYIYIYVYTISETESPVHQVSRFPQSEASAA